MHYCLSNTLCTHIHIHCHHVLVHFAHVHIHYKCRKAYTCLQTHTASETQSLPLAQSVFTLRRAHRVIFLSMNSGAMNIHHKYILVGINYGRLRVGVAVGGFPQVSCRPMSETSKTAVKSKSDVYVCVPVGMWWVLYKPKGGGCPKPTHGCI